MQEEKSPFGIMKRLLNAFMSNRNAMEEPEPKKVVTEADDFQEKSKPSSGRSEECRAIAASVTRINMSGGGISLILKQGPTPGLVVRCKDSRHLQKILTTVDGNTLSVSVEPTVIVGGNTVIDNNGNIVIGAGSSNRRNVSIQGNGNVVVQNFHRGARNVVAGDLIINGMRTKSSMSVGSLELQAEVTVELPSIEEIDLQGAGVVEYRNFSQDELAAEVSGSGTFTLAGNVGTLHVDISGSGYVDAKELTSNIAKVRVSGSGEINATVLKAVKARISGSGRVKIAGNPSVRDTNVSGSGRVSFL